MSGVCRRSVLFSQRRSKAKNTARPDGRQQSDCVGSPIPCPRPYANLTSVGKHSRPNRRSQSQNEKHGSNSRRLRPTSFTAAGTGTPDSVSRISATEYRRRQNAASAHAARTEQRALLRKAPRRVPESSTCSSEETQQATAWPSSGNSRCACCIAQKSETDIECLIRIAPRK
jgi:hypothetical protein